MRRGIIRLISLFVFLASFGIMYQTGMAKTKVSFWSHHHMEHEAAIQHVIDTFEAANPDIEIDWYNVVDGGTVDYYDVLTVAILGDVGPDVFYVRPGTDLDFVKNKWVYDIDDFVARDAAELQVDDFIPAQVDELQHNGRWWALPFDFSTAGLYFNQDMFDSAGVPYPTPESTWDDILEAARKLTRRESDGTTSQWGMHGLDWFFSAWAEGFYLSFGGQLFNEALDTSLFDHANNVKALEVPVRLIHELEVAAPFDMDGYAGLFFDGKAAMTIDGSWSTTTHRELNQFNFDVTALPRGPEGLVASATGGAWAMAADTDVAEAAWKWMKALASHDASRSLIVEPVRSLPPRISLMADWAREVQYAGAPDSAHLMAEQVLQHGKAVPRVGFPFHEIMWSYHHQLLTGQLSPTEAAERIHHDFQVELDRLNTR